MLSLETQAAYTEQELVAAIKSNCELGYRYLYQNYSTTLYGHIALIVSNEMDAQDILQDVFVNIWSNIDSYDPGKGRLYTWIFNITRNKTIDFVRSKAFQKAQVTSAISPNNEEIAASSYKMDCVGLRNKVEHLELKYQIIVDMVYLQGFKLLEVSECLDMPLGTVKSRLRKAIVTLRKDFVTD